MKDMMDMNLQPHNPRHRKLINLFGSFSSFYCNGGYLGFLGIIGVLLALLGTGLVNPGNGCSSDGKSKGKGSSKNGRNCNGRNGRGLQATYDNISFIQSRANYEKMSDKELKDLIKNVLHGLEINMPNNQELHSRDLFLQLLGIVNCNPQPPTTPQNNDPIAVPDKVTMSQNQKVTISILANDSDPNNDTLTVISKTAPAKGGNATLNPDQTIAYTPPSPDFCGQEDTFEYTISDGNTGEDTALVTIAVNCHDTVECTKNEDCGDTSRFTCDLSSNKCILIDCTLGVNGTECCNDADCSGEKHCVSYLCALKGNPSFTLTWFGGGTYSSQQSLRHELHSLFFSHHSHLSEYQMIWIFMSVHPRVVTSTLTVSMMQIQEVGLTLTIFQKETFPAGQRTFISRRMEVHPLVSMNTGWLTLRNMVMRIPGNCRFLWVKIPSRIILAFVLGTTTVRISVVLVMISAFLMNILECRLTNAALTMTHGASHDQQNKGKII
jgi:hypothetical protein